MPFGCVLGQAPGGEQASAAGAAILAAEPRYAAGDPVVEPGGAFLGGASGPHPAAGGFVVEGRGRVGAEGDFAQPLRVVGDGSEVERADELRRAGRPAVIVKRPERQRFAPREAVRVVRSLEAAPAQGVQREGGVGVQIPEERLAQRVAVGAGLPRNEFARLGRSARRAPLLGDVDRARGLGLLVRSGVIGLARQSGDGGKASREPGHLPRHSSVPIHSSVGPTRAKWPGAPRPPSSVAVSGRYALPSQ